MKKGRCATMTHDYKRHGTTTLFAALNVSEGRIIGRCMQRHRHQDFIRFLNTIEADIPAGKIIHIVLDNYATHKHAKVRAWLDRQPPLCLPLHPDLGLLAQCGRGFLRQIDQAAVNRFLKETNDHPKPFVGTADPDKIIATVKNVGTKR